MVDSRPIVMCIICTWDTRYAESGVWLHEWPVVRVDPVTLSRDGRGLDVLLIQVAHLDVGINGEGHKRRNGQNGAKPKMAVLVPSTMPTEPSQGVEGIVARAIVSFSYEQYSSPGNCQAFLLRRDVSCRRNITHTLLRAPRLEKL